MFGEVDLGNFLILWVRKMEKLREKEGDKVKVRL
jgi:hypothetical protein